MDKRLAKTIWFTIGLLILIGIVVYANAVFLIAFAATLLAIFLNAVGRGAKRVTHLPYPFALLIALIVIIGLFILTCWLYSPLISEQFQLLIKQMPQAIANLRSALSPFFGRDFLERALSFSNQKLLTQLVSVFSTTVGSLAGFVIFLIVGLYLAFNPTLYTKWILFFIPKPKQKKVHDIADKIGQSLRWWLLGKFFSMIVVGILAFIGLMLLRVSLAFILAILAALLTFIPYVGAILSSIPAILIGFTESPLKALYVIILYVGIHVVDGYLVTPFIEQRTVSIPPALTIMAQILLIQLIGGIGLALATPLAVVAIALMKHTSDQRSMPKVVEQPQKSDKD
jgi:predicted PurR-regulated permease PerM